MSLSLYPGIGRGLFEVERRGLWGLEGRRWGRGGEIYDGRGDDYDNCNSNGNGNGKSINDNITSDIVPHGDTRTRHLRHYQIMSSHDENDLRTEQTRQDFRRTRR